MCSTPPAPPLGAGSAVQRDYSKSMKHYWDEAAHVPDLTDATAVWPSRKGYFELRGDDPAEPVAEPVVRSGWSMTASSCTPRW